MTIDILFLAKNRLEYTRQALAALLANTNWDLVRFVDVYDEDSTDGTMQLIAETRWPVSSSVSYRSKIGSPAGCMSDYLKCAPAGVFAKIDNDTIVPPGWLDACVAVMTAHPELDLLGIEPPASRVPHWDGMKRSAAPEIVGPWAMSGGSPSYGPYASNSVGYSPCQSIGGIGLMRTKWFTDRPPLKPHSTYGGFTEAQVSDKTGIKGWLVPPIRLFLLDRLPIEPWASLGREYERKFWQRSWQHYPLSAKNALWGWWEKAQ